MAEQAAVLLKARTGGGFGAVRGREAYPKETDLCRPMRWRPQTANHALAGTAFFDDEFAENACENQRRYKLAAGGLSTGTPLALNEAVQE